MIYHLGFVRHTKILVKERVNQKIIKGSRTSGTLKCKMTRHACLLLFLVFVIRCTCTTQVGGIYKYWCWCSCCSVDQPDRTVKTCSPRHFWFPWCFTARSRVPPWERNQKVISTSSSTWCARKEGDFGSPQKAPTRLQPHPPQLALIGSPWPRVGFSTTMAHRSIVEWYIVNDYLQKLPCCGPKPSTTVIHLNYSMIIQMNLRGLLILTAFVSKCSA